MLSDEQIKKYQLLHEKYYHTKISREEAYARGAQLLRLIELIFKPMTESEFQKLQERRKQTGDLKS